MLGVVPPDTMQSALPAGTINAAAPGGLVINVPVSGANAPEIAVVPVPHAVPVPYTKVTVGVVPATVNE